MDEPQMPYVWEHSITGMFTTCSDIGQIETLYAFGYVPAQDEKSKIQVDEDG